MFYLRFASRTQRPLLEGVASGPSWAGVVIDLRVYMSLKGPLWQAAPFESKHGSSRDSGLVKDFVTGFYLHFYNIDRLVWRDPPVTLGIMVCSDGDLPFGTFGALVLPILLHLLDQASLD